MNNKRANYLRKELDRIIAAGSTLETILKGTRKSSSYAEETAWLWLEKWQKDTKTQLHPVAMLQQRAVLAAVIQKYAIEPACRADRRRPPKK